MVMDMVDMDTVEDSLKDLSEDFWAEVVVVVDTHMEVTVVFRAMEAVDMAMDTHMEAMVVSRVMEAEDTVMEIHMEVMDMVVMETTMCSLRQ